MDLKTALLIVQIILAIVLVVVLLMQAKGSTLGGLFGGGDSSVYRTRRGFEKTLFQFTIVLSIVFFLIALLSSIVV